MVQFSARFDALPQAMTYLQTALQAGGADAGAVLRAQLILEELFCNSVLHGYGGDSAHAIWLGVHAAGFHFEDEAPRFNPLQGDVPTAATTAPAATVPLAQLPVGGVGLLLIRALGSAVSYDYRGGRNCVKVSLELNLTVGMAAPSDPVP